MLVKHDELMMASLNDEYDVQHGAWHICSDGYETLPIGWRTQWVLSIVSLDHYIPTSLVIRC
jgi:hypothetical protein